MKSSRPLSVAEAAALLGASDAYVRRLLLSQQLYGIKVGPVWAIYPADLESFQRMRRPPGRPPKSAHQTRREKNTRTRIDTERAGAGTDAARRRVRRR